jgi:lactonase
MTKSYQQQPKNMVPLPPGMENVPVIKAEPWFEYAPGPEAFLEGPAFDREGNLFATSPHAGLVIKITPQKKLSTIFNDDKIKGDGTAVHKDGRLFFACMSGELLVMNPDGSGITPHHPKYDGKTLSLNDLVFDAAGNIYVTDFNGSIAEPTGGVYRISCDGSEVHPILRNLVMPNGISLSPEGNVLWVGETGRNTILRLQLQEDGISLVPIEGVTVAHYGEGFVGPDSNKVDSAGNLYQAIMGQGRILVLNNCGITVANVVIPGREEGKFLRTTNLAFKPGTREGYITTSGEGGAWIYKFEALAEALQLYSHC